MASGSNIDLDNLLDEALKDFDKKLPKKPGVSKHKEKAAKSVKSNE